jgi:hypothetical protein
MSNNGIDSFVWPTEFACTIITENIILPNVYSIHVGLEPVTTNQEEIGLGFKKIKLFSTNYLSNALFLNKDNPLSKSLNTLDTNMVLFPVDPYDYLIASIFYRKFSAIMENYFVISFLTIDSAVGDHVQYTITELSETNSDLDGDFWWNKNSVNTGTNDHTSWEDLNLVISPKFVPVLVKGGLSDT